MTPTSTDAGRAAGEIDVIGVSGLRNPSHVDLTRCPALHQGAVRS